jgi:hypothetical protein
MGSPLGFESQEEEDFCYQQFLQQEQQKQAEADYFQEYILKLEECVSVLSLSTCISYLENLNEEEAK